MMGQPAGIVECDIELLFHVTYPSLPEFASSNHARGHDLVLSSTWTCDLRLPKIHRNL